MIDENETATQDRIVSQQDTGGDDTVAEKEPPAEATSTATKTRARRKTSPGKDSNKAKRKAATDSRHAAAEKLEQNLKDVREALKVARTAAKAEITLLRDKLDAALKREELVKISEKKAKRMIAAGENWEKKQLAKLKKSAKGARKALSRKGGRL